MDHPVHRHLSDLSPAPGRPNRRRRARLGPALVLGLAALALVAAGVWLKRFSVRPAGAPTVLGSFPDFSLPDASGGLLRKADLAGEIWIADFVPARCPACAVRSLRMADLQTSLEKARTVRLVTFVSDPDLESPAALGEFAREYGARPGRWSVLAGSPPVSAGRLLLVDGSGRIRGSFSGDDPAAASEILDSVGALLRESLPRPADFR